MQYTPTTEERTPMFETHAEVVERRGHYVAYWRCFSDGTRAFAYSDRPVPVAPVWPARFSFHPTQAAAEAASRVREAAAA